MKHFRIDVTYDPKKKTFSYKDQDGNDGKAEQHCKKADKIKWHLVKGGASMTIQFPDNKDGNPFEPPTSDLKADTEYTFNDHHLSSYRYNVFIFDATGTQTAMDDPQIMFDDGNPLDSTVQSLPQITYSAKTTLQDVITELTNAGTTGDPNRIFFPKGISLITLSVVAGPITVTIKVAGSDAPSNT